MFIRMKNSDVAHEWANGVYREIKAARVFTSDDGQTIYSYGTHWPIARRVSLPGRDMFAVFNPKSYGSSSTSTHTNAALRANHLPVVYGIPDSRLDPSEAGYHRSTIEYYRNHLRICNDNINSATKQKQKEAYIYEFNQTVERIRAYFRAFEIDIPSELVVSTPENYAAAVKAEELRQEKARIKAQKDKFKLFTKETLPKWRRGEGRAYISTPMVKLGKVNVNLDYVRYVDDRLETTQAVEFSTAVARRLWPHLLALPEDWPAGSSESFKFGSYDLKAIWPTHIVVGCHSFTWDELRRIAVIIGAENPDAIHPIEKRKK